MASSIIHLAIAQEVGKIIGKSSTEYFIGALAPDVSKIIGDNKAKSHFHDDNNDYPNLDRFLANYKDYLSNDFVLGYYVHLITDYFWFKYFMREIVDDNEEYITKLDGSKIKLNGEMLTQYMYNDYSNLNNKLITKYKIDTSIFYNDIPNIKTVIIEIPNNKLPLLMEKMRYITENAKETKAFIFNVDNIDRFILSTTNLTVSMIKSL